MKFNVDCVFVDIDATLVDPIPGMTPDGRNLDQIVAEVLSAKRGVSADKALREIQKGYAEVKNMIGKRWPFGVMEKLGLNNEELWRILFEYMNSRLFCHDDVRGFLEGLRKIKGLKVYAATTNPHYMILAKLAVGGLADMNGSPYFDFCEGGEEVYPGGKASPEFFKALVAVAGTAPEKVLMVGDSPIHDLNLAKAAGIRNVILPDRMQKEEMIYGSDGGIYVKSLETVLSMVKQ